MAARTTRDLYLQVSGDVTSLQTASKAGRSALLSLGSAAGDVQAEVQKAFADMASNAPATAKQIEASYTATFNSIRQTAKSALSAPSPDGALKILDAGAAEQAAAAAEAQAAALRQVANASAAAAEKAGEASVAHRVLAVAMEANAQQAEQEAAALRSQATVLGSVRSELQSMGVVQRSATTVSEQHRQSMVMAGQQLQDFAVQVGSGQSVITAFTQQIGQFSFAVQGMGGKMAGVASFLTSGWGIALTIGLTVLGPLVSKLMEAGDAAEEAKAGASGLAEAQSVLGQMFDLTSGKLQKQNDLLRLNARLMAMNLRAEAQKQRASSQEVLGNSGKRTTSNQLLSYLAADQVSVADKGGDNARVLSQLVQAVRAKQISPEGALAKSANVDFSGLRVTREQFQQALIDGASAVAKEATAGAIERSLTNRELDPMLRRATAPASGASRGARTGSRRTAASSASSADRQAAEQANRDRAYQQQLDQAQDAYAKAQQALSDTAQDRLAVELKALRDGLVQSNLAIDDQVAAKKLTQAEADKLKAINAGTEKLQEEAATRKAIETHLDEQLAATRQQIEGESSMLQLQSALATTNKQRRDIALRLLELEEKEARAAAERKIDSPDPKTQMEGWRELDDINDKSPLKVAATKQQNASPFEQYKQQLHEATDDTNAALQSVAVKGLQGLESQIASTAVGILGLKGTWGELAASILEDLAKIEIEKAILGTIGGGSGSSILSIFGLSSGGKIEGRAGGGKISGPGTGTSDSILALIDGAKPLMVSNGESIVTAAATQRYWPLIDAMNKGTLPKFATGGTGLGSVALPSLPSVSAASKALAEGRQQRLAVDVHAKVEASPEFDVRMQSVAARTVGASAEPIMAGAKKMTIKALQRASLPGGFA